MNLQFPKSYPLRFCEIQGINLYRAHKILTYYEVICILRNTYQRSPAEQERAEIELINTTIKMCDSTLKQYRSNSIIPETNLLLFLFLNLASVRNLMIMSRMILYNQNKQVRIEWITALESEITSIINAEFKDWIWSLMQKNSQFRHILLYDYIKGFVDEEIKSINMPEVFYTAAYESIKNIISLDNFSNADSLNKVHKKAINFYKKHLIPNGVTISTFDQIKTAVSDFKSKFDNQLHGYSEENYLQQWEIVKKHAQSRSDSWQVNLYNSAYNVSNIKVASILEFLLIAAYYQKYVKEDKIIFLHLFLLVICMQILRAQSVAVDIDNTYNIYDELYKIQIRWRISIISLRGHSNLLQNK